MATATLPHVQIDPEFRALIPPLSPDEREKLEQSLLEFGRARDPLAVWNGVLIDGHNRYELCQAHDLPFTFIEIDLPDKLAARIWIRWNQLARRNLTDDQRAMQVAGLVEDLTVQSKHDRAQAGRRAGGDATPAQKAERNRLRDTSSSKRSDKTGVRTKASKRARVSERKVKQAQTVRKHSPEKAARVEAGELSLADAVRETKRDEIREKLDNVDAREAKALAGVYDVIVIDPPWPMEKIERDERPNQSEFDYPTMNEADLRALALPCADDCHVWVWTTHRFLPMAFRLLDAWGLNYVCTFVWHKPGGFQPIGLPQYNCEFAIYARKGSASFLDTKAFHVCFDAKRGKHSEKPEEFYNVVRRVTAGRRADMFNRREIEGFDGWGKEVPGAS